MFDRVIFYNDGHLGDTFLNKPFIKEIKKHLQSKAYAFANNNYPREYVNDIVDEYIDINSIRDFTSPHKKYTVDGSDIYINTWMPYCFTKEELEKNKPLSSDGISYNFNVYHACLSHVIKEIKDDFDIAYMLTSKNNYVLEDYPAVNNFDSLKEQYSNFKKILLYNQPAYSGQSDNIDHTQYIVTLAEIHKDVVFFVSSPIQTGLTNIVCMQDYVDQPDLLQLAYFSLSCDIICGPGNATTISTWTKSNINNPHKIYITINRNDKGEAMLFQEQECTTYVVKSTPSLYNHLHTCLVRGAV